MASCVRESASASKPTETTISPSLPRPPPLPAAATDGPGVCGVGRSPPIPNHRRASTLGPTPPVILVKFAAPADMDPAFALGNVAENGGYAGVGGTSVL